MLLMPIDTFALFRWGSLAKEIIEARVRTNVFLKVCSPVNIFIRCVDLTGEDMQTYSLVHKTQHKKYIRNVQTTVLAYLPPAVPSVRRAFWRIFAQRTLSFSLYAPPETGCRFASLNGAQTRFLNWEDGMVAFCVYMFELGTIYYVFAHEHIQYR